MKSPLLSSALSDPRHVVALLANGLLDRDEPVFSRLTTLATQVMRVPTAMVTLIDQQRHVFHGAVGMPAAWKEMTDTPLVQSIFQLAIALGESVVIADVRTDGRFDGSRAVAELNICAYAAEPIRLSSGAIMGAFCVIDSQPRSWTQDDNRFLNSLAGWAATELELRISLRESEQRRALLDAAIGAMTDGLIAVNETGTEILLCNPEAVRLLRITNAESLAGPPGSIAPHLTVEYEDGSLIPDEQRPLALALRNHHVVDIEVWIHGERGEPRTCISVSARPIPGVGAIAVLKDITDGKKHHQRLSDLAYRDQLTQVFNRRGFIEVAQSTYWSTNLDNVASLFFIDIDGMKVINDQHGHAVGDGALVLVTEALRRGFRDGDVIGRIGGDEFAVFAAGVDEAAAASLRRRVMDLLLSLNKREDVLADVSVSIGVHSVRGRSDSLQDMILTADADMYRQKRKARDSQPIS
jgi:diguanylate cyclase (GGDEF)-like protein